MSIALKRLELSNFRKHTEATFIPAEVGITSISAPNGFGKSTIVDSLSWVLYGTKPAGVSKASELINWDADIKTDKVFVEAILQVDQGFMKVERKIVSKTGAVECRVWWKDGEDSEWPEYTQSVAGPGVSHSEPYIKKRLKMDEAGFLTAVLVQQKQVDTLISARPKERAEVIERMTGIEAISNALAEARSEQSLLKKQAQNSEVDEEGLESTREEYEETVSKGKKLFSSLKKLKASKESQQEESENLKKELLEEEEKSEESIELKDRKTRLEAEIEAKEESLKSATKDKDEAKEKISHEGGVRSLDEIKKDYRKIDSDHLQMKLSVENLRKEIEKSKARSNELKKEISAVHAKFSQPDSSLEKAEDRKTKAEKAILNAEKSIIENNSQIARLERAISTLRDDHGKCPTCLQEVSDLDSTVELLQEQKDEMESSSKKMETRVVNAQKALDESSEIIETLTGLRELEIEAEELVESLPEKEKELEELTSEEIVLSKKKMILEREMKKAESQEENRERYETLLKRAQRILDEIESKNREKISVEKSLSKINAMSDRSLNALRRKSKSASEKFQKINEDFINTRHEMRLIKKDTDHLSENIARMERDIEKHRKLLETVEVATTSVQVIDEFRTERMKTTLPAIEVYASELLSRFTDGKLISLKLDAKFNTTVMNSAGVSCPVGLLSAGELSAAALALRIAISMLFYNDGEQSLIILDEVLVSQDSMRVELILETIKDVCKGQVVLIAHNAGISSIADKIVDLSVDDISSDDDD